MSPEPQYNRGGVLPTGPTLVTIEPEEHIAKPDPSGAWVCVRAEHKSGGHECDDAWWDHRANLWRKIPRT